VGDPSGRAEQRKQTDQAETEHNTTKLEQSVTAFFGRAEQYAETRLPPSLNIVHGPKLLNNKEWLQDLRLLDFLRTAGIHIRLNTMLARERCVSLSHRMEYTAIVLCAVYDRAWCHKKVYPSPNSRINYYKHMISSGFTKT
jgi:tyrosyl-tRNA synthetase